MNKDQRTYVVKQIRDHAKWLLDCAVVVNPIEPSESDVAYKLVELGFTVNERPIYQVTLPPTEEHDANNVKFQAYMDQINALLKSTTESVLDPENEDSPATIFNTFTTNAAKIELGK